MSPNEDLPIHIREPTVRESLKQKAEEKKLEKNKRKKGKPLKFQSGGDTMATKVSNKERAIDTLRERFTVRFRDGVEGSPFKSRGVVLDSAGTICYVGNIDIEVNVSDSIVRVAQNINLSRHMLCNVVDEFIQCDTSLHVGDAILVANSPLERNVIVSRLPPEELRTIKV